ASRSTRHPRPARRGGTDRGLRWRCPRSGDRPRRDAAVATRRVPHHPRGDQGPLRPDPHRRAQPRRADPQREGRGGHQPGGRDADRLRRDSDHAAGAECSGRHPPPLSGALSPRVHDRQPREPRAVRRAPGHRGGLV
ncbi:MAG: hypothetical protein AVDCRST_MAG53-2565, partial [uncultured Solirubrobacteraceae bacterium]